MQQLIRERKPDPQDPTNIAADISGDILTLQIDLSQEHGRTSSQKNILVASTHGNIAIGGGLKMSLNVFKPV